MIRHLRLLLAFCAVITAVALHAQQGPPPAAPQDPPQSKPDQKPDDRKPIAIAGKWTMTLETAMGNGMPALELKQDGEKITGTYTGRYGSSPITGTLKGTTLEFKANVTAEGTDVEMVFTGEVSADGQTMRGDASLGPAGDATWIAHKNKT